MEATTTFLDILLDSLQDGYFVKLTLSKCAPKTADLHNIYGRLVLVKGKHLLSLTYRYPTQDIIKNLDFEQAIEALQALLGQHFLIATLRTTRQDLVLQYNKKRRARLQRQQPSIRQAPSLDHNQAKQYLIEEDAPFLEQLGIAKAGRVLKAYQDKYRQINKYVEIMAGLLAPLVHRQKALHIVDMGSGKGYLTFALAHYLHQQNQAVAITGIELRQHLTDFCNEKAQALNWSNLNFVAQDIQAYKGTIDVLIALHACNTATDLALAKGIDAQAQVVVVAPCCHRQVRQDLQPPANAWNGLLKHGILLERQAELLTDSIRALLLETEGYKSKVFEFISSEHTAKNLMITGVYQGIDIQQRQQALEQINTLKMQFGLSEHYLEKLLVAL
ncbi:MAG: SAM-dependent methyltransferase [Aureispira sp.]